MSNFVFRNLRTPQDYIKRVVQQDDLIKIAIANDKNTAQARKMMKAGTPQGPTEEQQKTPEELALDLGFQESEAMRNIDKLGNGCMITNPQDSTIKINISRLIAAELVGQPDKLLMFNASFPAIKNDLLTQFNPRLMTPDSFIMYLMSYLEQLQASKGLSSVNSNVLLTKELKELILSQREIQSIKVSLSTNKTIRPNSTIT